MAIDVLPGNYGFSPTLEVLNGYLYAVMVDNSNILRSSDGLIWFEVKDTARFRIHSLKIFGTYLYAITEDNSIIRSLNGTTWNKVKNGT